MNKRHQQFINEYFLCNMNGTKAYRRVYPDASYDSARTMAANLLANANISAEIERRLKENIMSADEALARMSALAAGSHADLADVSLREDLKNHPKAYLVKTVKTEVYEDAKGKLHHKLQLELHDSLRALEDVLKAHGRFVDKVEHSGNLIILPAKESSE